MLQARAPKVDLNFKRSLKMLPCIPRNGALFSQHRTFFAPEPSLNTSRKDIQCWDLTQRLRDSQRASEGMCPLHSYNDLTCEFGSAVAH